MNALIWSSGAGFGSLKILIILMCICCRVQWQKRKTFPGIAWLQQLTFWCCCRFIHKERKEQRELNRECHHRTLTERTTTPQVQVPIKYVTEYKWAWAQLWYRWHKQFPSVCYCFSHWQAQIKVGRSEFKRVKPSLAVIGTPGTGHRHFGRSIPQY